jgi:RimJ/RimL family protein N-acetyltransferase
VLAEQRLETGRLLLVPSPPDLFELLARDRAAAESEIGVALPADWPDPAVEAALRRLAKLPSGWGIWLVVSREENAVVGTAGFKGPPGDTERVELGYGIAEAYRNRGYATEAARALVDWALAQPGVARVVAECERDNAPSIRVLEKAGLHPRAEAGPMLRWETS